MTWWPGFLLAISAGPAAAATDLVNETEVAMPRAVGGGFALVAADGSGPVALARIELERGYPNGDYYCPPSDDPNTICLGASIVFHPGRVERIYGQSSDRDRRWKSRRFKQIGGHAVRWVEGGRWLAIIEQTEADYWYIQWKTPIRGGRFCIPDAVSAHYRLETDRRFRLNENGERCYRA